MGMGRLGRREDLLLRGPLPADGDIVADGAREQIGVLADIGDLAPQGRPGHGVDVLSIHEDLAALHVPVLQQQRHHRALAPA